MNHSSHRLLDLFSGIGGFSLGLEKSKAFETVAFCEIEPFQRGVLHKHWPKVTCYDDIRSLTAGRLAADGIKIDAICGGFPCQDISLAGKGAGLAGERSGLWREYFRLVCELRPKLVIVENVTALLGRGIGVVLGDLASLGYDAEWECIPAFAVGLPHERDRIWIVAYHHKKRAEGGHQTPLSWLQTVPWLENVRRAQEWAERSAVSGSGLCRASDGIPARVDRTGSLGNAVVPAIPALIGQSIKVWEAA